jgi:hypothetical protein
MSDKVVFLAYSSDKVESEGIAVRACARCRNKTYLLIDRGQDFPMLRCAACGDNIGAVGWAHDAVG